MNLTTFVSSVSGTAETFFIRTVKSLLDNDTLLSSEGYPFLFFKEHQQQIYMTEDFLN